MNILIVDDKASVRSAMAGILRNFGLTRITQAVDGEAAWDLLNTDETAFDLVISDLEMPGMTGMELLRAVRGSHRFSRLPFIMSTTVSDRKVILETMRLGVQAYIVKPFDSPTIELKLKQAGIL